MDEDSGAWLGIGKIIATVLAAGTAGGIGIHQFDRDEYEVERASTEIAELKMRMDEREGLREACFKQIEEERESLERCRLECRGFLDRCLDSIKEDDG